jgi:hypothetical protein
VTEVEVQTAPDPARPAESPRIARPVLHKTQLEVNRRDIAGTMKVTTTKWDPRRMPQPTPLPFELALAPFRVGEARAMGVSAGRLRAQDLHAPFHGVRTLSAPLDLRARCLAYSAKMTQGHWFSHTTAAALWGLPLPRHLLAEATLHVSSRGREPHGRGVIGHRMTGEQDLRFIEGLPVVSPCEAWCHLAGFVSGDALVMAGDHLLGWPIPLADAHELDAAIRRWAGRRGVRALVAARRDIRAGSASARETRLRLLVLRAGFPEPELNGPIEIPGDLTHGDLVFRAWRVLLEYDGEQHRMSERQFLRDVDRLNSLALAGWLVVRVNRHTPDRTIIEQLDAALRSRGWHPGL